MLKKKRYRFLLFLVVFGFVLFLFRSYLYSAFVSYRSIGQRVSYVITDKELINCIENRRKNAEKMNVNEIISLSLSITASELNFTASKNNNDPNKLIHSKTAHCVGYAAFFAATCNYLLKQNHLANEWVAKPHIGQLYFCGVNVHPYFHSAFFKDHDFVMIENMQTGEFLAVDATVYDYFGVNFVRVRRGK
jgi:hypothetical protein